jgi:hypothetical protein
MAYPRVPEHPNYGYGNGTIVAPIIQEDPDPPQEEDGEQGSEGGDKTPG